MATGNWTKLGGGYLERSEVYEGDWEGVRGGIVAAAPGAGAVALWTRRPAELKVVSAAGRVMTRVRWDHDVVFLGWTPDELLLSVLRDGTALLLSLNGSVQASFALGAVLMQDGVAACSLVKYTLVARAAGSAALCLVADVRNPRPAQCPAIHAKDLRCFTPILVRGQPPSIIAATGSGRVLTLQRGRWTDTKLESGPFDLIAIAPSQHRVALFAGGEVYIMASSLQETIAVLDTETREPPIAMAWCGNDTVALQWPDALLVVGMQRDFVRYDLEDDCHMTTEKDGIRLFSTFVHEWIHPVSPALVAVYQIGSLAPAALLFDAVEAFERHSAKADGLIRELQTNDTLEGAVQACLDAASEERDKTRQARLLKAASYGKLFCAFDAEQFTETCRTIRVLNALNTTEVGMPMSPRQFLQTTPAGVIQRLVSRGSHLLALRIASSMDVDVNPVLQDWACLKMERSDHLSDDELAAVLHAKLHTYPGMSYTIIASAAFRNGRDQLAMALLDREPRASDQVPLLVGMKLEGEALDKAVASGDTDLVFVVLLTVLQRDEKHLFRLLETRPRARTVFEQHYKKEDRALLKRFYYFLQKPTLAADLAVLDSFDARSLGDARELLDLARQFYAEDKNGAFRAQLTQDQLKLLEFEKQLDKQYAGQDHVSFIGLPLSRLMERLITLRNEKQAFHLRKEFQVPEKRVLHIQVKTFAKLNRWNDLAALATGKSPIGFLPFVEACVEHRMYREAETYIKRLSDTAEQLMWFCHIGYYAQAVDVAVADRNTEALHMIRASCRDPALVSRIDALLSSQ